MKKYLRKITLLIVSGLLIGTLGFAGNIMVGVGCIGVGIPVYAFNAKNAQVGYMWIDNGKSDTFTKLNDSGTFKISDAHSQCTGIKTGDTVNFSGPGCTCSKQ